MSSSNRGYGFRPTDEELVDEHLRNRIMIGCDYLVQEITDLEADICNWEPSDLFELNNMVTLSDGVKYFFYPKSYKYQKNKSKEEANGKGKIMVNRATKQGKWKPSGDPRKVRIRDSNKEIGRKRGLYFFTDQVNEENNRKIKANHSQNSHQNKLDNKKNKVKHQNSYQNKTDWVLHEYELLDVPPTSNKYFLGKLMKQSKPTKKSRSNGETSHQLLPNQVQPDFHEPAEEVEVSNDIQNQSCISEQTNEIVTSFPVHNYTTYPEGFESNQDNFVNYVNPYEIFGLSTSHGNYVPDVAIPPNLQVEYMTAQEPPNMYNIGAQNHLNTINQYSNSFHDLGSFHNNETYLVQSSNQQNFLPETEAFNGLHDSNNYPIADLSQMDFLDLDDLDGDGISYDELFGALGAPNNYDWVQNQSNINQQHADEFRNLNPINNQIAFPHERNKAIAAETEVSNLSSVCMTESSYSNMESFRKRSRMEDEGSSIEIENEVAQAQAKISRFQ